MASGRDYLFVVSYVMLMPGYFVYHLLVSQGVIPPVLGGYWTIACVALAAPLLLTFVRVCMRGETKLASIDYLFGAFVIIYVLGLLYSYAENKNIYNASVQVGVIPQFIVFYVLFRLLPTASTFFRRANITSFLVMSTIILSAYGSEYHWAYNPAVVIAEELKATYQGYGLAYLVVASTTIPLVSRALLRQVLFGVALAALFVNGARSELFAMLLLFVIYEIFVSRQKIYLMAFFMLVASVIYFGGDLILGDFGESRVLGLYYDGRNDESANDRLIAMELGLQTIADHPIFGNFGDHPPGFYIHNALSAWVDLGLIGFGLYVILLVSPAALVYVYSRSLSRHQIASLLSLPILMFFFASASKHYSYQLLPVSLGLFLNELMLFRGMAREAGYQRTFPAVVGGSIRTFGAESRGRG